MICRIWKRFKQGILIVSGILLVGLGVLGIFLPLMPATPFLLLAAICFANSSKKFYDWLLNNRYFGSYIKNYREGKGISARVKIFSMLLLWISILCSIFFVAPNLVVVIILFSVAILSSYNILRIRTMKPSETEIRGNRSGV